MPEMITMLRSRRVHEGNGEKTQPPFLVPQKTFQKSSTIYLYIYGHILKRIRVKLEVPNLNNASGFHRVASPSPCPPPGDTHAQDSV